MAQLPGGRYIIQQINGQVILFERYTEEELVRFRPSNHDAAAKAQKTIYDAARCGRLTDEEQCFAHFWCGYFHACS